VIATGEVALAIMDANLLKTLPLTKDWAKKFVYMDENGEEKCKQVDHMT